MPKLHNVSLIAGGLILAACGASDAQGERVEANKSEAASTKCSDLVRLEGACKTEGLELSLVDLQTIGSHNSYKIEIPENELQLIALTSPDAARGLDYGHLPIEEQLDLGMRQLEIDVARDPDGGLY